jgi:hypothetical protein
MKGAHEFALLIPSGRYDNLRIESGHHARGYTFSIFIVTPNGELEVYGILGGSPGWTEYYGWIYHGSWEIDFYELLRKQKEIQDEQTKKNLEAYERNEKSEHERRVRILSSYGKPE